MNVVTVAEIKQTIVENNENLTECCNKNNEINDIESGDNNKSEEKKCGKILEKSEVLCMINVETKPEHTLIKK